MPTPVVAGCPGWLFYSSELHANPRRATVFPAHIRFIEKIAAFLDGHHIPLVIVPVPDKSRVHAEFLCNLRRAEAIDGRFDQMTGLLKEAGIKVVDVLSPLRASGGETFYRTDSHWNERGAGRAAETVAASLREWGLASSQRAEFRATSEPPRERVGDLIVLLGLGQTALPYRPAGDIEASTTIEQRTPPGVGLFDELPAPDTVLLGTSFSLMGNFAKFLAMSLGAPIDNRALPGGSLTKSAQVYFADPIFVKSPPRVVVWEVPERIMESEVAPAETTWDPGDNPPPAP